MSYCSLKRAGIGIATIIVSSIIINGCNSCSSEGSFYAPPVQNTYTPPPLSQEEMTIILERINSSQVSRSRGYRRPTHSDEYDRGYDIGWDVGYMDAMNGEDYLANYDCNGGGDYEDGYGSGYQDGWDSGRDERRGNGDDEEEDDY